MSKLLQTVQSAGSDFLKNDCLSSAAALGYYSIFSLPPLLVIVLHIAHFAGVSDEEITGAMHKQLSLSISNVIGKTEPVAEKDQSPQGEESGSPSFGTPDWIGRVVGGIVLLFSATGLFAQLQVALNRAWEVEADPKKGGSFVHLILKRIFSLGMVLVIAFLLLISLVITAFIEQIATYFEGAAPSGTGLVVGVVLNNLATVLVATVLFACMFKVLPDAEMSWRDMWVGAFATAVLFVIGKAVIGWYLQRTDFGAAWGSAAASIIGVLVWIYYTTIIVLLGAEFTEAWATAYGQGVAPAEGAQRAVKEKRRLPETRDRFHNAGPQSPMAPA